MWPLAARAQQGERMRRIGVLMSLAAEDPELQARITAFVQELQKLGWTDGRNVQHRYSLACRRCRPQSQTCGGITCAGARRHPGLGRQRRRSLAHRRPAPCRSCSRSPRPVGAGFVESLARPGGNATGFSVFDYSLSGKWLELLKQIAPGVTRVAVIRDAATPQGLASFAPPISSAVAQPRGNPGQRARRQRDRARHRGCPPQSQ